MKKIFTLIFSCLFSFTVFAVSAEEELFIRLETENPLTPLSILPFLNEQSKFSAEYIKSLENIFLFDFDHNGMTLVNKKPKTTTTDSIHVVLKQDKLHAKISNFQGEETTFGALNLTGSLSDDAYTIHSLSDKIHEKLFGIKGIASTKILYTKRTKEKNLSEVWESDYNGGNAHAVMNNAGYCVTPAYIPPAPGRLTGSFIYVSYKSGQPKIYVASLKEGLGRMLFQLSGNQLMPSISRQRNRIAFINDATGNPDLFIQDFDPEKGVSGKPRHLYTAPNATQGTPSFSPEGERIAFVSNKSGTERIYVLKIPPIGTPLNKIHAQLISKFTTGNTAPAWSPDGSKIAYCAKAGNFRQIMIYDFSNGTERQLTNGPGNKENPAWAPNSFHLVYNTTDSADSELYLINLKQAEPIKISSGPGEKRFPSWEPR